MLTRKKVISLLGTWFGLGKGPVMPGTFGTLGAVPLVGLLSLGGEWVYMAFTLAFAVFAILVAQAYEESVNNSHDASEFVLDEVAGFLITMTWLPVNFFWLTLGFVVFRFFDMVKPFPISWLDKKVPGGFGVVADDLLAGVLASVLLQYAYQNRLHESVLNYFG